MHSCKYKRFIFKIVVAFSRLAFLVHLVLSKQGQLFVVIFPGNADLIGPQKFGLPRPTRKQSKECHCPHQGPLFLNAIKFVKQSIGSRSANMTKQFLMRQNVIFSQDSLLFCDACDKGYHMTCHTPKLDQMPSGKNEYFNPNSK